MLYCSLEFDHHALGIGEKDPARLREPHSARQPFEDIEAEIFLEELNLSGKGGLGDVERLCRAMEVLQLGYGYEVT